MIVRYEDRALQDLDDIEGHIAADAPFAARKMYGRLLDACEALADFPMQGRASFRSGLREITTVPPYLIIYSVGVSGVLIRRIVHGARLR